MAIITSVQNPTESQLRIDLAAAFRISERYDWHEGIANHFSVAVGDESSEFLINPKWRHFSNIKASDLVLLRADDDTTMQGPDAPDPTAWYLHGTLHKELPHARCIMHLHPPYTTALSCLKDPRLKPIDQTTARFFNRIAIDMQYGGMADNIAEARRICELLRDKSVLLMGNHGILVLGNSVAEAFDTMYHFERAAKTLMMVYNSGQPVSVLSDEIAEKTARGWSKVMHSAFTHLDQVKHMLDRLDDSYRQ
ncbi:class II aldolase/adducin family protein [Rhizobium rhizogenes]|uniref:class II aldolase/adducin family protein n=1 Tax=Rhizobium rhizogenes TaxID=359 RepID=UPI001573688B|nr:class II aldolase/adducin family protein [Rhizobium rhizogenes]NTH22894.1 hypothetical protein [Rhizobium rhizogenes]NTH35923.1 hypothetical protein [Rhizobium rhizogenes]